jgi:hypothetical protein
VRNTASFGLPDWLRITLGPHEYMEQFVRVRYDFTYVYLVITPTFVIIVHLQKLYRCRLRHRLRENRRYVYGDLQAEDNKLWSIFFKSAPTAS